MLLEDVSPGSPSHWLRFAMSDLELACSRPVLVMLELLCFHAQQAVEKALKALLIAQGVEFPKTHNLRVLIEMLKERMDVPDEVMSSAALTEYAVSTRYPGEYEEVTEEEWRDAIQLAESVVDWAKQVLA